MPWEDGAKARIDVRRPRKDQIGQGRRQVEPARWRCFSSILRWHACPLRLGCARNRGAMKRIVLLFAALLVAGCGEKSSSEGSESVSEKPTASNESADASLWEATLLGEIEPAKKAIADGANVNAKKEDGQTPLHSAVVAALDSGDNKVIELLIENGADVNAKIVSGRHQGMTPLDITGVLSEAATLTKRLREQQGKTDDIPVADLLRKHGAK